jgi:antirestriction protein ArdC
MKTNENYERITAAILSLLDNQDALAPWQRPWRDTSMARSMSSGKAYNGINRWYLTALADAYGWSPWFGTYKQIEAQGGQVRKGEKSNLAILWKPMERVNDQGDVEKFMLLRTFNVFSASQADGLPEKFMKAPTQEFAEANLSEAESVFDEYVESSGVELRYGGDSAYYSPALDKIVLPRRESFVSPDHFFATVFHEAAHSTGHKDRLNRPGVAEIDPGDLHKYSREELVAEFGSALVLGALNLDKPNVVENQAAYLAHWKRALADDPQALIWAAGRAEKAANMILGVSAETPVAV